MADYRFRETEDGQSILEKKVEGQPDTWVEDLKTHTPYFDFATKDYVKEKVKEANPDFKGTFDDMADIEALENVNANDWTYLERRSMNGSLRWPSSATTSPMRNGLQSPAESRQKMWQSLKHCRLTTN